MKQVVGFLLLAIAFASCKDFKEPVFNNIENVKFAEITGGKPKVTLQMKYFNPNKFQAKLKTAEGDAWIDNSYLGHFTVDTMVSVPPNAEFFVPVNLAVDMKSILQNSLSLFLKEEVNVTIKGTIRAGRGGFYKNFPLNYNGKQNLSQILR